MTRIFYSWQNDLPNGTNRGFIEKAVEDAAKRIRSDSSIEVEPVVDRDTAGVPGAPDIAGTIFQKIDGAAVFVCDVSIIGSAGERPTPNPNVLIELGYAKKALGPDRIVMVMNTAFGAPELLPFDLRPRRVVTYDVSERSEGRQDKRRELSARLERALRDILGQAVVAPSSPSIAQQATRALEERAPNGAALLRRYMSQELPAIIAEHRPPRDVEDIPSAYARLEHALSRSVPLMAQFGAIAGCIAEQGATEAARALYGGFSHILEHCDLPAGYSGMYNDAWFAYDRFLAHEFMVTLFGSPTQGGEVVSDGHAAEHRYRDSKQA